MSYDDPVSGRRGVAPTRISVGDFGDKFRKAREAKGISLDDVSNVTKISSRMLQAIEQEHFHQLPGGVFNKGFIRAYAKHLGLNDEEAITEYLACLRQAQIDAQAGWSPSSQPVLPEKRPLVAPNKTTPNNLGPNPLPLQKVTINNAAPNRLMPKPQPSSADEELPNLQLPRAEHVRPPRKDYVERRGDGIPWGTLTVVVAILLGFVLWRNHTRNTRTATSSTAAAASSTTTVAAGSAPPIAAQAKPPAVNTPSAPAARLAKSPADAPATSAATGDAKPSRNALDDNNPAGGNTQAVASPPPGPSNPKPASAPLTLVIRAAETSWISVSADGQAVIQETLIAPAHTSVRAGREIVVRIGNAAGISFLWNGQEIPAQGAEAEVKTYVFDAAGMRVEDLAPRSDPKPDPSQ